MKQALVFRLNKNDILTTEEDYSPLFYYADIIKEEIIFYLFNYDMYFFLEILPSNKLILSRYLS